MSVIVISKRVFRMNKTSELVPLLKKLRTKSENQQGFISRATYSKMNDPGECIVVSKWETADDWGTWIKQKEIREIQWQIDSLLGEKTVFDIYNPENF